MPLTFSYLPLLPATPAEFPFLQQVLLQDGKSTIASARWMDTGDGVVQLLDLQVTPSVRRTGIGKKILNDVLDQARKHCKHRKTPFRRIWIRLDQKAQVIGRAFLAGNGFHHVATINGLHKDQDDLIYVRAMD